MTNGNLLCATALSLALFACHASQSAAPAAPARTASPSVTPSPKASDADLPALEDVVRAIAVKACPSVDTDVCAWAQGFLAGGPPALPTTASWTLGTSSHVDDAGKKVGKLRYVVFATGADASKVGVMNPVTESAEEERFARAAVEGFRTGAIDRKNPLIAFIDGQQEQLMWLEAKPKGRELELTAPHTGPGAIELRAIGDTLYFCQLEIGSFGGDYDLRPALSLGSAPRKPLAGAR